MSNARELAELAGSYGTGGFVGMKNRIINGAMMIDQRNAGASVALSSTPTFITDRFTVRAGAGSGHTAIQSTTAPNGFTKSLLVTVGTGATPTAGNGTSYFHQIIEGFNIADLAWGTANAQPVTLSFKVRSSLTGTFGGSFQNYSGNRSYPFTFTISAANTFEDKTITIAGDTVGSWQTNNSGGIVLFFDLGCGSDYLGTAGAWAGADYRGATGDTKLIGTSGATFYITGVQLEKGSTATSFDYRPYGTELALCQRYYYRFKPSVQAAYGFGQIYGGTDAVCLTQFPVTMRIAPTSLEQSGTASDYRMWKANTAAVACTSVPLFDGSTSNICGGANFTSSSLAGTAGQITQAAQNNANGYLGWSAEL